MQLMMQMMRMLGTTKWRHILPLAAMSVALTIGGCGGGDNDGGTSNGAPATPSDADNGAGTGAAAPVEPSSSSSTAPTQAPSSQPGAAQPSTSPPAAADPYAPPTDEQVIADISKPGVISVELSSRAGNKEWSTAHDQYFWEKGATVVRPATIAGAPPEARVRIVGFARYEITGGRYSYREFKVSTNEYEGIDAPSTEESLQFVRDHLRDFLGGVNNVVVNADTIEIAPADDAGWTWHSMQSVSFNVNVAYDQVVSYTEIARMEGPWEARFYRDGPTGPWQRIMGSQGRMKEVSRTTHTAEEVEAMPRGVQG
jgi:hypothetical protein